MSKKRGHHEEHENLERWLVSYADFITLLFATFVVLYAISSVDAKKFERMSAGIKSAFLEGAIGTTPIVVDFGSPDGGGSTGTQKQEWMHSGRSLQRAMGEEMARVEKELKQAMDRRGRGEQADKALKIRATERGVVVSLAGDVFFAPGSADVQPSALPALEALAEVLRQRTVPLRVEGHTDDRPIASARFPSNWELSTGRATAVARILVEQLSIDPARIAAGGYAEHRPTAPNDGEENRARNRRVDVVLLAGTEAGREPSGSSSHETLLRVLDELGNSEQPAGAAPEAAAPEAAPAANEGAPAH